MSKLVAIFKADNEWNEKAIVGGLSFLMMVITAIVDVATGIWGIELEVQEFIYNSILFITLGSFSISGLEKWSSRE